MSSSIRFVGRFSVFSLLAAAVALWAGSAQATTYAWTGGSTGLTWDTTDNNWGGGTGSNTFWDSGTIPNNVAQFNTANATAAVSGNVYASGIYLTQDRDTQPIINNDIGNTGVIYLSSATAGITGSGDWGATINVPIVLNSSAVQIGNNSGGYGRLQIYGGITGTSNLTLAGNHAITIGTGALNITGTITSSNNVFGGTGWMGYNTEISAQIGSGVSDVRNTAGRLNVTNASNLYGTTTIDGGNVYFGSAGSIGSGDVTVNANGSVTLSGATDLAPMLAKIATGSAGAIAFDASSSVDVNLTGFANLSLGAANTVTFSGGITPGGTA